MKLVGGVVGLVSSVIGFAALPGLVLLALVARELLPDAIEWGVIKTAFSLLQNEWRYEEVKALVLKAKPAPAGGAQ